MFEMFHVIFHKIFVQISILVCQSVLENWNKSRILNFYVLQENQYFLYGWIHSCVKSTLLCETTNYIIQEIQVWIKSIWINLHCLLINKRANKLLKMLNNSDFSLTKLKAQHQYWQIYNTKLYIVESSKDKSIYCPFKQRKWLKFLIGGAIFQPILARFTDFSLCWWIFNCI